MTKVPEDIQLESKPCPMGCSFNDVNVLSGQDLINNLPGVFNVVRCTACGLLRTNPRPTPESMAFYYPDDYPPYQAPQTQFKGTPSKMRRVLALPFNLLFRRRNTLATILPGAELGRALEIGCASGSFMKSLNAKGWEVEGLEFSPSAAETARRLGFKVHAGSLESAPDPEAPFDLIVGWMVLEHLHDPVESLKKLYRWSQHGGWLAISVPNTGVFGFKIFKNLWYDLHLPNHLYHFTPETLEKLLMKCGWKVEKVFHQRVLNSLIASIGRSLGRYKLTENVGRKFRNFPKRADIHPYFYPLSSFLGFFGQTGRITVWARKMRED